MKVDIEPELKSATRILNRLSKLGTLGIFVVNAVFVLGLAIICCRWEGTSPSMKGFLQASIAVLALVCLLLVPFVYALLRIVDAMIVPRLRSAAEKGEKDSC